MFWTVTADLADINGRHHQVRTAVDTPSQGEARARVAELAPTMGLTLTGAYVGFGAADTSLAFGAPVVTSHGVLARVLADEGGPEVTISYLRGTGTAPLVHTVRRYELVSYDVLHAAALEDEGRRLELAHQVDPVDEAFHRLAP